MRTQRATEARMSVVDARMAARLRARGYLVEKMAGPDHVYRPLNDAGTDCHAPGCRLYAEDHREP